MTALLIPVALVCFLLGAIFERRMVCSRGPRCPWPLCGVELPKNPLFEGVRDNYGNQRSLPEKCPGCDEIVQWDGRAEHYIRLGELKL